MESTFKGVVYPSQTDAMGHMTVQYYVAAFDQAFWHFVTTLGYDPKWRNDRSEGWADVRYEIDYRDELKMGDLYRVESEVIKVGNTSLVSRHKMLSTDAKICAEILMTSVYFDITKRSSKPIPEPIKNSAFALLEEQSNN